MNRRLFLKWTNLAGLTVGLPATSAFGSPSGDSDASPDTILLKDYRPESLYKISITDIPKAKFPIIDMRWTNTFMRSTSSHITGV